MNDMEQKKKTPQVRFKGYDDTWEQRKLGEFGKATGGTTIESEFDEKGKYRVISIGSYSETSKYIDQGIRVNKTNKTENRILDKNNLTMILNDKTASGNIIGRVLLIDADDSYVYNQRTERIEVYEKDFVPEFLYQLLNAGNIRSKIIRASQGNTQIYVNWTAISELIYEIPISKEEQTKIAKFFYNLDNLITLHQRKYDKLIKMKRAMLEKMFPKNGSLYPEIRFEGFTDAWEQRKLGELMNVTSVKRIHQSDWTDNGVRFLRARDIVAASKNEELDDYLYISKEKYEEYSAISGKVDVDDLLVTGVGTIGVPYLVENLEPLYFKDGNIIWFQNQNKIDGKFLYYSFIGKEIQSFIMASAGTGTVGTYTIDTGKKTPIRLPSKEEQKEIGVYFHNLDHLITLHQRKLEKLKNIKKACLEKMFV